MRYRKLLSLSIFLGMNACVSRLNENNVKKQTKNLICKIQSESESIDLEDIGSEVKELVENIYKIEGANFFEKEEGVKMSFLLKGLENSPSLEKYRMTLNLMVKSFCGESKIEVEKCVAKKAGEIEIVDKSIKNPFEISDVANLVGSYYLLSENYIAEISKKDLKNGSIYMLVGPCHPCRSIILENKDSEIPYTVAHFSVEVDVKSLKEIVDRFSNKSNKKATLYSTYSNELLKHMAFREKISSEEVKRNIEEGDNICESYLSEYGYETSVYRYEIPYTEGISVSNDANKYLLLLLNKKGIEMKKYFPLDELEIKNLLLQQKNDEEDSNNGNGGYRPVKSLGSIKVIKK